MARKRKNPAWLWPVAIVSGVVVATGAAVGYRVWQKRREKIDSGGKSKLPEEEPAEPGTWQSSLTLNDAMPKSSDFPMGWTEEPAGFYGSTDYSGDPNNPPDYGFAYRVLRLKSPSDACRPTPCRWVAVWAGENEYSDVDYGWEPTHTRDEAYAAIEERHRDFQK